MTTCMFTISLKQSWEKLSPQDDKFQYFNNLFPKLLSNFSRWFPTFQVSQHDFVSGSCNRPCIYAGSSPGEAKCCKIIFSLTITACMFTISLKQSWEKLSSQDHKFQYFNYLFPKLLSNLSMSAFQFFKMVSNFSSQST